MSLANDPRYRTYTADEYASLPDDRTPWIVRDLLPTGGTLLVYGAPKTKKSLLVQQMIYAIANGDDHFLTFPVEAHGPVLYVQLDTARTIWKERAQRYREVNAAPGDQIHVADKETTPLPFEILNREHYEWLRDTCKRIQPLVVVIDVLRKATMVDENSSAEMIRVANALESAVSPSALITISHAKKPQDSMGDYTVGHDNRGSGSIMGNVDGMIRVSKKSIAYLSRTVDEGKLKILWDKNTYLFSVDESEFDHHLQTVLEDASLDSIRAKAARLEELTSRPFEACRMALRRKLGKLKG